jgi:hypothetical protein
VTGADKADLMCGNLLVGSARISFTCGHRVYLKLPPRMFFKRKTYNLLSFYAYKYSS